MNFELYIDFATAFHTLTPITNVIFVERLIDRLCADQMVLNVDSICTSGVVDGAKLRDPKCNGFVSCNCPTYLKDLWCEHVLMYALVKGVVVNVPPKYRAERIGPAHNGRNPMAVRGGALGWK